MWPFSRKPAPQPERTFGDMVAYSLTHERTRGDWVEGETRTIVNEKLGYIVQEILFDPLAAVLNADGKIPLEYADKRKVYNALCEWRKWNDARKRAAALTAFVDGFEKSYGRPA